MIDIINNREKKKDMMLFNKNEIKSYSRLAIIIEKNHLSRDSMIFDVIDTDPTGELFNDLAKLNIEHRIFNAENTLVTKFLEALNENTLNSFVTHLDTRKYSEAQITDFKNYELLNMEGLISLDNKNLILRKLGLETNPLKIETLKVLKSYGIEDNIIMRQLISIELSVNMGLLPKHEFVPSILNVIKNLQKSNDAELIQTISNCKIFETNFLSAKIRNLVIFKLTTGIEINKINKLSCCEAIIEAVQTSYNPLIHMVLEAYLNNVSIDELVSRIKKDGFDPDTITDFKQSKLWDITHFYSKDHKERILIKLKTGLDNKVLYNKAKRKFDNLNRYTEFASKSMALTKLFLSDRTNHIDLNHAISYFNGILTNNDHFLPNDKTTLLEDIIVRLSSTKSINTSVFIKLNELNKSMIKSVIKDKAYIKQYNAFVFKNGGDYYFENSLSDIFYTMKHNVLSDLRNQTQLLKDFTSSISDGHTTSSPVTTLSSADSLFSQETVLPTENVDIENSP